MAEPQKESDWAIENDWSEEDQRQYERYSTHFYLCVYDRRDERLLGHVVDISLGGLRLIGSEALRMGEVIPLRMEASLESGRRESCELQGKTVWSGEDENPGWFTAGLEFLDLSASTQKVLHEIIAELGG